MSAPVLYLVPTPIDGLARDPAETLPRATLEAIQGLSCFVVENLRSAEKFLRRVLSPEALEACELLVLDEHTPDSELPTLMAAVEKAGKAGILSEAGCPCVADPGSRLVAIAHARGARVLPLVGPSAILMALMASGLSGQAFSFVGYLPAENEARPRAIEELGRKALADGATRVFIETPYRNAKMASDLAARLPPELILSVSWSLGCPEETTVSMPVARWKKAPALIPKAPAVFCVGRGPYSGDKRQPKAQSKPPAKAQPKPLHTPSAKSPPKRRAT